MGGKRKSVRQVAREAKVDVDEALIALWDNGFDYIVGPNDLVKSNSLNRARRALGLATRRDLKNPDYWKEIFNLEDRPFKDLLLQLGIIMGNAARNLPKNAVSRLKVEARRRNIDPISGNRNKQIVKKVESQAKFIWQNPGHKRDIRHVNEEEVKDIHFELVKDFSQSRDPIDPPGIKSESLLSSAVNRPRTSNGGVSKYTTVESCAATLLHAIILNHSFHNGNKRTALVAMLVFLDRNNFMVTCRDDELFKLVLQVAQHSFTEYHEDNRTDREVQAIAEWLCDRVRLIDTNDYPVTWLKLKRILKAYNCEFEFPKRRKDVISISRKAEQSFMLGLKKKTHLNIHVSHGKEGKEVEKKMIRKIREELHLDDLHGIDSNAFYGMAPTQASDFIIQYSKILKRLAKL